jgi:nucleotide-binding universal stress UspA family protein
MSAPLSKLACDNLGMNVNRLLLPIDLAKCPLEIFPLANGFTKPFGGEVVLLHVFDPQADGSRRAIGEIDRGRAAGHLERLGQDHLRPSVEAICRVRSGIPHEEILAEATATNADLILLPTFAPSIWRRWAGLAYGETARSLVIGAPCNVFVVDVRTRFNCFRRWAREESLRPCAT